MLAVLALAAPARAQGGSPESAALGNCFVMKSTGADRLALVRWISGALLSSAKTADLAKVDPAKREETERQVAAIFTRLFTKDCLAEARAVASTGDASTGFRQAGEALGRIAMSDLLSDPAANAAMSGFARFLSKDDFKAIEGK
jgi:hypothetical protein